LKFIPLLLFILFVRASNAQTVRLPLTVKYAGLGAYSKNFSDIFSATANQASLAQLKTGGLSIYGERRFMLQELNGFTALVAMPSKFGTFGFQGDYFGSAAFNENQLGALYARKINDQIDIGVKFNYHTVRIPGYGAAATVNFEGGVVMHITEQLHTGIHVYNPTSRKVGSDIPVWIRLRSITESIHQY
jgi:hypothetical protein